VLQRWFLRLRAFYDDHLIPFGADEALAWGSLYAPLQLAGRPPALVDSMIAATALVHALPVVTRNGSDFEPLGVEIINPWQS
jgi:predicted nucleic acid-binding protein